MGTNWVLKSDTMGKIFRSDLGKPDPNPVQGHPLIPQTKHSFLNSPNQILIPVHRLLMCLDIFYKENFHIIGEYKCLNYLFSKATSFLNE